MPYSPNPLTTLAEHYVNDTDASLFLTGKAGTGKTTFLRHLVETTSKRCVVLAPTGVAAINAGGSTLHSFFQLPPSLFIPEEPELMRAFQAEGLFRPMRKEKLKLIKTLDLVIIDEISMVRADLMDAVDDKLRTLRHSDKPFGGVQLLMIGDVHQLPPVVTAQEEPYMARAYPSPFFFHSRALRKVDYVTIQLTQVYRQQDPAFVSMLNDVRDGRFSDSTMRALNGRLFPKFHPPEGEDYIRLTTHNRQADSFNERQLAALRGAAYTFNATVEGNFPASSMPTNQSLVLKVGTQVMFVKNDTSGAHRYYNGKICVVVGFDEEGIVVRDMEGENITVKTERWESLTYSMGEDGHIRQTVDGSFTQYPLRLAWAITIHKAQGLTFDHVIIDAAAAFAFGQVYVALSRCRTLDGLVLATPITPNAAFGDQNVTAFAAKLNTAEEARQKLAACETEYCRTRLDELFDMDELRFSLGAVNRVFSNYLDTLYPMQAQNIDHIVQVDVPALATVARKFRGQLHRLLDEANGDLQDNHLKERISKGVAYFFEQISSLDDTAKPMLQIEVTNKAVAEMLGHAAEMYQDGLGQKRYILERMRTEGFSVAAYNKARLDFLLQQEQGEKKNARKSKKAVPASVTLDAAKIYGDAKNPQLIAKLSGYRAKKAHDGHIPPYYVLQQKVLLAIANVLPVTRDALQSIPGIGTQKMERYGSDILRIVQKYCKDNDIAAEKTQALDFKIGE